MIKDPIGQRVNFQGVNWTLNLKVEIIEIDNTTKSESSAKGNYLTHLPYTIANKPELMNNDHTSKYFEGVDSSFHKDREEYNKRKVFNNGMNLTNGLKRNR